MVRPTPRFRCALITGTLLFGGFILMREYSVFKSLRATHAHIDFVKMPSWRSWTTREELASPYEVEEHRHEQLMTVDVAADSIDDVKAHIFALTVGLPIVAGIFIMPWLIRWSLRRALRWWVLLNAQRENRQILFENRQEVVHVGGLLFHHQTLPHRRRMRQPLAGVAGEV